MPADPPTGPVRLEVSIDGVHHVFGDWAAGTTLLEHLESRGLTPPYSCREGECAACVVRLLAGDVRMLRNEALDQADLAGGYRLACQSVPSSDAVEVTYD